MDSLMSILKSIDGFMWGKYMIILLYATGILLTIRLRGIQFRRLGQALKLTFSKMYYALNSVMKSLKRF
jgi:AGCS family alanine or glycine:cation symporter